VTIVLLAVFFGWSAHRQPAQAGQDQQSVKPEIVPMGLPLDQRFGEDDNPLLAIHFSGDTRGSLGPCG
jgi:hypothetical protein